MVEQLADILAAVGSKTGLGKPLSWNIKEQQAFSNSVAFLDLEFESGPKRLVCKHYQDDWQYQGKMYRELRAFELMEEFGLATPEVFYADYEAGIAIIAHVGDSQPNPNRMLADGARLHVASISYSRKAEDPEIHSKEYRLRRAVQNVEVLTRNGFSSVALSKALVELDRLGELCRVTTFTHRDFIPTNAAKAGGRIVYFDAERAGFSHPTDDLACLYLWCDGDKSVKQAYRKELSDALEHATSKAAEILEEVAGSKFDLYFRTSLIDKYLEIAAFFAHGCSVGDSRFQPYKDVPDKYIACLKDLI